MNHSRENIEEIVFSNRNHLQPNGKGKEGNSTRCAISKGRDEHRLAAVMWKTCSEVAQFDLRWNVIAIGFSKKISENSDARCTAPRPFLPGFSSPFLLDVLKFVLRWNIIFICFRKRTKRKTPTQSALRLGLISPLSLRLPSLPGRSCRSRTAMRISTALRRSVSSTSKSLVVLVACRAPLKAFETVERTSSAHTVSISAGDVLLDLKRVVALCCISARCSLF